MRGRDNLNKINKTWKTWFEPGGDVVRTYKGRGCWEPQGCDKDAVFLLGCGKDLQEAWYSLVEIMMDVART